MDYSTADTSRFDVRNADGSAVDFIDFTKELNFIGSIIDSSLISDTYLDEQIKAATSAFGGHISIYTQIIERPRQPLRQPACKR